MKTITFGKPLCERSETALGMGRVINAKVLSRRERAVLFMRIYLEQGKTESARKPARIGIRECMKAGEHERAMKCAEALWEKEVEAVAESWMEALIECGMRKEAYDVSKRYGIPCATYEKMERRFDDAMEKKYGKRAAAYGELEEAVKWGDKKAEVGARKKHGFTDADVKLVLFCLMEEFDAWAEQGMLGVSGGTGRQYKDVWEYLGDTVYGAGNEPFGKYREGFDETCIEYRKRIGERMQEGENLDRFNLAIRTWQWRKKIRALLIMEAFIREGRDAEAKKFTGRNGVILDDFGLAWKEAAAKKLALEPGWEMKVPTGIIGRKEREWIAIEAAMLPKCAEPIAVAERYGVLDEVMRRAEGELSRGLFEGAVEYARCIGNAAKGSDLKLGERTWSGPELRRRSEDYITKFRMGEGHVRRAALGAISLIEELGQEKLKARAKLLVAEGFGLEGEAALLRKVSGLIG